MNSDLHYQLIKPHESLSDFVESFWMLHNPLGNDKAIVVLPDGRVDLIFSRSATGPIDVTLMGMGTKPDQTTIPPKTIMFTISFKPLATEYILHDTVGNLLDAGKKLPASLWNFDAADFNNFDVFCNKVSQRLQVLVPKEIDSRKQRLFELIFASKGSITVKELSEKVFWSSRQINRYFNQQYGISLKAYCNILRFRASLEHIAKGKLFPEENFADQTHFIKQIKKFAGVVPKELFRNEKDRFILLSTLYKK